MFSAILMLITANLAFAQEQLKNTVYLEAGGNGLFGSVNYERRVATAGLGFHAGVGMYSEKAFYLTLPVGINYIFPLKNKNNFIDGGLGVTWTFIDARIFNKSLLDRENNFTSFIPSIGYRKHGKNSSMWRVNLSPVINNAGIVPWMGVALGKRF